jgi:hypothetical protein
VPNGKPGKIELETTGPDPAVTITLDPDVPSIVMRRVDGSLALELSGDALLFRNELGHPAGLNSKGGMWSGGSGEKGWLHVFRSGGGSFVEARNDVVEIEDSAGRVVFKLNTGNAALYLGAVDNEGDLILLDNGGKQRIHINGGGGQIFLRNKSGENRIDLNGGAGEVVVRGTGGADRIALLGLLGQIIVKTSEGQDVFKFSAGDASLSIGGVGQEGNVALFDSKGNNTLFLDGAKGDIVLENADCAEEFDVAEDEGIEPGMVMVIDGASRLRAGAAPYDKRVAGVLSGAGDCRPGIILGRARRSGLRLPLALMGKTYCKVDARYAPIALGDLLTTSPTRGHAMKATEPARAFGAVLGKALAPLPGGTGLLPVLVALQ